MSADRFKALVAEFGATLGLGDIAPDEDGYGAIEIDGLAVHLQYDDERDEVVIFARLGQAEPDRLEEIYTELLAANLFWQGTRGATLSIEPEDGIVFIADRLALERLDPEALGDWLGRFTDIAEHWRDFLARANAGEALAEPGDDTAPALASDPAQGFIRV